LQTSLTKSESDRRTVRTPWADHPSFNLCTTPETIEFLSQNFQQEADRLPSRAEQFAVQFGTPPRAKNGSVRAQTRQRRTVRHLEADRPQVHFQLKRTLVKRS